MNQLSQNVNCEICGHSAPRVTALGSRFCLACQEKYYEFLCERCNIRVVMGNQISKPSPLLCSACQLKQRLSELDENQIEKIIDHLKADRELQAILEAQKLLSVDLGDASHAVTLIGEINGSKD